MITRTARNGFIADITETGNTLDPAAVFVGIFVSVADHGLDTVLADLVLPPGALATAVAVTTWGVAHEMADGKVARDAPVKTFRPASSAEATVVSGWFLATAATAGTLLEWGLFDNAVALPDETFLVDVLVRATIDPQGQWDATVMING